MTTDGYKPVFLFERMKVLNISGSGQCCVSQGSLADSDINPPSINELKLNTFFLLVSIENNTLPTLVYIDTITQLANASPWTGARFLLGDRACFLCVGRHTRTAGWLSRFLYYPAPTGICSRQCPRLLFRTSKSKGTSPLLIFSFFNRCGRYFYYNCTLLF